MIDQQVFPEIRAQSVNHEISQCNFRQQIQHLLACCQHFGDETNINFRFPAAGDTKQQHRLSLFQCSSHFSISNILRFGQLKHGNRAAVRFVIKPRYNPFGLNQNFLFNQCRNSSRSCHFVQLRERYFVFSARKVEISEQCTELSCRLLFQLHHQCVQHAFVFIFSRKDNEFLLLRHIALFKLFDRMQHFFIDKRFDQMMHRLSSCNGLNIYRCQLFRFQSGFGNHVFIIGKLTEIIIEIRMNDIYCVAFYF
ncbi:hypothetical protein DSECCO2_637570 [anaerobic digester metagenome]